MNGCRLCDRCGGRTRSPRQSSSHALEALWSVPESFAADQGRTERKFRIQLFWPLLIATIAATMSVRATA